MPTKGYECTLTVGGSTKLSVQDVTVNTSCDEVDASSRAGAGNKGVAGGLIGWEVSGKSIGSIGLTLRSTVAVVVSGGGISINDNGVVTAVGEEQPLAGVVTQNFTIKGPAA